MALKSMLPAPTGATRMGAPGPVGVPALTGFAPPPPPPARKAAKQPPPYGRRRGFVPRHPEDFGDGGAFPEIPVAQFPLGMAKPGGKPRSENNAVVPVNVGADGEVRYDAIVTTGTSKKFGTSFTDLIERPGEKAEDLARPSREKEDETMEKTRMALEKIVQRKITSSKPISAVKDAVGDGAGKSSYIRYTPANLTKEENSGAKQRIIKMVEVQQVCVCRAGNIVYTHRLEEDGGGAAGMCVFDGAAPPTYTPKYTPKCTLNAP